MSWRRALATREVEAVALATLPVVHAGLAQEVLQAGKHVFVEKPLALEIDDARRTIALARSANRILMVGHLL